MASYSSGRRTERSVANVHLLCEKPGESHTLNQLAPFSIPPSATLEVLDPCSFERELTKDQTQPEGSDPTSSCTLVPPPPGIYSASRPCRAISSPRP